MTTLPARAREPASAAEPALAPELLVRLHEVMLRSRCLEERLIRMNKQGDGYFWVGGPGEEALNASLGLLVHKGQGPLYDYLHLHYRSGATLLAMGADPVDTLRQMKSTMTDPYSRGRNFCSHYAVRKWNVLPVSSPIEVQFSMAPGTAMANKRAGGRGITIVQGGDAGTAEGDFASCLIWCSRPGHELPCLLIVANNGWGISTPASEQHAEKHIADRGRAFGIKSAVIDGNDAEVAYLELMKAMEYVRNERKPFLLEATVSRLYGHSSASGTNLVTDEPDCLTLFEAKLEQQRILTRAAMDDLRARCTQELLDATKIVREELPPTADAIWDHVFAARDLVGDGARHARDGTQAWEACEAIDGRDRPHRNGAS
ncbi:MAG: thiamine pyrophosphate-dependent dehydrogenase E1 component subunit alpha [Myxococcota bacterium]|nr:thiamine pyrophosphate-dependent dehydrogenase E1 component subunit alpha [Myxococcota bacterium]